MVNMGYEGVFRESYTQTSTSASASSNVMGSTLLALLVSILDLCASGWDTFEGLMRQGKLLETLLKGLDFQIDWVGLPSLVWKYVSGAFEGYDVKAFVESWARVGPWIALGVIAWVW